MNITEALEQIQQRADAATEGPWKFESDHEGINEGENSCIFIDLAETKDAISILFNADWGTAADAEFIAHARTDIPKLVEALRTCAEALKRIARGDGKSTTAAIALDSLEIILK